MSATDTSRSAYHKHVLAGEARTQRERILRVFEAEYPRAYSRAEIAKIFSRGGLHTDDGRFLLGAGKAIPLASVCGRINTMIDKKDGNDDLEVAYEDRDPETGHTVEYLRYLPDEPTQKELPL